MFKKEYVPVNPPGDQPNPARVVSPAPAPAPPSVLFKPFRQGSLEVPKVALFDAIQQQKQASPAHAPVVTEDNNNASHKTSINSNKSCDKIPLPRNINAYTFNNNNSMAEESQLQSFRRGPTDRILQVEALYHPELRQHIVFWDDILEVFPSAISVLNGSIVISRARDDSFRFIEPRCIRHQPGKVLQVVFAEDLKLSYPTSSKPSTSTKATGVTAVTTEGAVQSQNLTLQNIEQWAQATAENTMPGMNYAPSIYSQFTDTTAHPFKPLYVPTEADAESLWDGKEEDPPPHNMVNALRDIDQSASHSPASKNIPSTRNHKNQHAEPQITTLGASPQTQIQQDQQMDYYKRQQQQLLDFYYSPYEQEYQQQQYQEYLKQLRVQNEN